MGVKIPVGKCRYLDGSGDNFSNMSDVYLWGDWLFHLDETVEKILIDWNLRKYDDLPNIHYPGVDESLRFKKIKALAGRTREIDSSHLLNSDQSKFSTSEPIDIGVLRKRLGLLKPGNRSSEKSEFDDNNSVSKIKIPLKKCMYISGCENTFDKLEDVYLWGNVLFHLDENSLAKLVTPAIKKPNDLDLIKISSISSVFGSSIGLESSHILNNDNTQFNPENPYSRGVLFEHLGKSEFTNSENKICNFLYNCYFPNEDIVRDNFFEFGQDCYMIDEKFVIIPDDHYNNLDSCVKDKKALTHYLADVISGNLSTENFGWGPYHNFINYETLTRFCENYIGPRQMMSKKDVETLLEKVKNSIGIKTPNGCLLDRNLPVYKYEDWYFQVTFNMLDCFMQNKSDLKEIECPDWFDEKKVEVSEHDPGNLESLFRMLKDISEGYNGNFENDDVTGLAYLLSRSYVTEKFDIEKPKIYIGAKEEYCYIVNETDTESINMLYSEKTDNFIYLLKFLVDGGFLTDSKDLLNYLNSSADDKTWNEFVARAEECNDNN